MKWKKKPTANQNISPAGKHLADLDLKDCRFAVTDHAAAVHLFCGRPSLRGYSYCQEHRDLCFDEKECARL